MTQTELACKVDTILKSKYLSYYERDTFASKISIMYDKLQQDIDANKAKELKYNKMYNLLRESGICIKFLEEELVDAYIGDENDH